MSKEKISYCECYPSWGKRNRYFYLSSNKQLIMCSHCLKIYRTSDGKQLGKYGDGLEHKFGIETWDKTFTVRC